MIAIIFFNYVNFKKSHIFTYFRLLLNYSFANIIAVIFIRKFSEKNVVQNWVKSIKKLSLVTTRNKLYNIPL